MVKKPLAEFGPEELLNWHIERIRTIGNRSVVWVGESMIEFNHRADKWESFIERVRYAVGELYKELQKPTPAKKSSNPKPPYVNRPPRTVRVVLATA